MTFRRNTAEGRSLPRYQIAQLNVGRAVAPMDHARMADFVGRLDEVNQLAEGSPGFVWRLQGDNGNATELRFDEDPLFIVNLSVWDTLDDLFAFTYRSDHKALFARRFDWFERSAGPNVVLWWQPASTIPTVEDALRRLRLLASDGPTSEAFTFKQRFAAPDERGEFEPASLHERPGLLAVTRPPNRPGQ